MNDGREMVDSNAASATGAALGMGSAATAAAVSACCAGPALGPLVISLFGAGGAVAIEGLRPYTAPLLAFSGVAVGASFWLSARSAKRCSSDRSLTALRAATRALLWVSGIVWIIAVVVVVWARLA